MMWLDACLDRLLLLVSVVAVIYGAWWLTEHAPAGDRPQVEGPPVDGPLTVEEVEAEGERAAEDLIAFSDAARRAQARERLLAEYARLHPMPKRPGAPPAASGEPQQPHSENAPDD